MILNLNSIQGKVISMPVAADPIHYNPYAWDIHDDPFPTYRRLRDEAPAYYNAELNFYALSRYDDVMEALHDPETFCSKEGITLEPRSPLPLIITMDPPEHTKMRRLISRTFTPRRMAQLEPHIRSLADSYMDRFIDDGECDLIHDFSSRLPMDVICEMIAVPSSDQDDLRKWTDLMLERDEGRPEVPPAGEEAGIKVFEYFVDHVRQLRTRPGDDLISGLTSVEVDGETLDDIDVVAFCFLLIIAGNETTTKLIGNALYWLTKFPDQRQLLRDDPGLTPDAVEETFRYDGSTQLMARTLTRDIERHGTQMKAGTRVLTILGSANRDERAWDDPDVFDMTRDRTQQHLALGHGIHVCLGAALARLEMKVALEQIHQRLATYEVDLDGCERIHSGNVRGYHKMPFSFTAA
jgi:cytochrome P450